MQAIVTKYHGPSNTRGSYVSAKCGGGSVRLGWDDALSGESNHKAAAAALILKLHWHRNHLRDAGSAAGGEGGQPRPVWYGGGLVDGSMVWVCAWPESKLDCSDSPAKPYVKVAAT